MESFCFVLAEESSATLTITIGVIATILGAVLGSLAQDYMRNRVAVSRISTSIPNLCATWNAVWYLDKNGTESIYVKDKVTIEKQKGVRIVGFGVESKIGRYTLEGQFNSQGILTMTYDFPNRESAVVGGVLLKVNATFKECEGHWHGYTRDGEFKYGRVVWKKTA